MQSLMLDRQALDPRNRGTKVPEHSKLNYKMLLEVLANSDIS
jgi:hypothetical protein